MELRGSCHCQAVRFSLSSSEPCPFMLCYCSICRKTNGAGGYGINLGGDYGTLRVEGEAHIAVYRARLTDASGEVRESRVERRFCKHCGSGLWVWSPDWPDFVHPFASAIDTELPVAPERTHIMLGSKASWVPLGLGAHDKQFDAYPDESLAAWHERLGLAG